MLLFCTQESVVPMQGACRLASQRGAVSWQSTRSIATDRLSAPSTPHTASCTLRSSPPSTASSFLRAPRPYSLVSHALAAEKGESQQLRGDGAAGGDARGLSEAMRPSLDAIDAASIRAEVRQQMSDAGLDVSVDLLPRGLRQRQLESQGNSVTIRGRCLASRGKWCVRAARRLDLQAVAGLQANVFHEPPPLHAFNGFFLALFKAELYSNLLYKRRNSPPDRHCCLLAHSSSDPAVSDSPAPPAPAGAASPAPALPAAVRAVGACDLTALADARVLCQLDGAAEYLYLSGMAVDPAHRRQGIASLLLQSVELVAQAWGFEYLVLHVHEDNVGARRLYFRAGYRQLSKEPKWLGQLLGSKRKILLAKRTNGHFTSHQKPM